jgi:hypothetical protein
MAIQRMNGRSSDATQGPLMTAVSDISKHIHSTGSVPVSEKNDQPTVRALH